MPASFQPGKVVAAHLAAVALARYAARLALRLLKGVLKLVSAALWGWGTEAGRPDQGQASRTHRQTDLHTVKCPHLWVHEWHGNIWHDEIWNDGSTMEVRCRGLIQILCDPISHNDAIGRCCGCYDSLLQRHLGNQTGNCSNNLPIDPSFNLNWGATDESYLPVTIL